MNIEAVSYAVPLIMVGAASGGMILSIWHRRFVPGAFALMLLAFAHALWSLGSAANLLSPTLPPKIAWSYVQYGGVLLLPAAAQAFAIEYTRRRRLSWKVWALLALEPLVVAGMYLTDPYHHLVGIQYALELSGPIPVLLTRMDALYSFHILYTYIALAVVAAVLARSLLGAPRHYRMQTTMLLVGLLAPWVASLVDISRLDPFGPLDLAPVAFMFTQLAFLLGVFRYRLLDILPMARSSLIERLKDGIIVLDEQDRVIDLNEAAKTITGCAAGEVIGRPVSEILASDCGDLYEYIQTVAEIETQITLGEPGHERIYELGVYPLSRPTSQAGRLVVLHDITSQKELQVELYASEEKYRGVVERSNDGIMILQDGVIRYANQSLAKMLGFERPELIDQSMLNLFPASERPDVYERHNRRLAGEAVPSRYETRLVTRLGDQLDVEINAGVMEFQRRPAVLAFIHNITSQKRAAAELDRSLALLRATIESTADGILVIGSDGALVTYNRKFVEMWNLPVNWAELPGVEDPFLLLSVHLKDPKSFLERSRQLSEMLEKESTGLILLKDGRIFERYVSPYRIGERVAGKVWNFRDVTRQKQAEEELQRTNARLSDTVNELELHSHKLALLSDMGDLLHSCATAKEAYAVTADFARRLFPGQSGALYMLNGSRNLAEAVVQWGEGPPLDSGFEPEACWALRRGRSHIVDESHKGLRCLHTGSEESGPTATICIPMIAQGETTGIFSLRGRLDQPHKSWGQVAQTVAESVALSLANLRLRETLQTQSISDPLTGLYNRRYMAQALDLELRRAARHNRPLGLLMIDIDHFKEFNDCYGHKAGDNLLQAFASYLVAQCREEDYACRYGGEEFLLILPEAPLEACIERGEGLRRGMRSLPIALEGFNGDVTISVGVSAFPENGRTVESLLVAADAALYAAKRAGRNRVEAAA